MVIDQVHGLQATSMSLNDRFTMLAAAPVAPARPRTPRRRPSVGNYLNQNMNRNLIEQIARRLEQQAKRQSLRQRLGVGPGALRRFGSESSLPGLRRANSFGDLSQRSVKSRIAWRQSNGNLNRSASFGNVSAGAGRGRGRGRASRGLRRRAGPRGRIRAGVRFARVGRAGPRHLPARPQTARRARGPRRGGILRNHPPKPVPTKEELDLQLDQYMAGTKSALDQELDAYMKNAMDLE